MNKKPILSEHEKKRSFSAKKKQKVVLKNLLVQPFERYWPELSVADVPDFVNAFRIFYNSRSSCKENTKATTSVPNENIDNIPKSYGNKLNLGLKSSVRCISSGKRLVLFISSKIKPKYIVDQIIIMALTQKKGSTIFCVPNMDEALFEVLGFSCQCLTILENESEIWNWSLGKGKEFPPTELFKSLKTITTQRMEVDFTELTKVQVVLENNEVDFSELYLRKKNSNERAFTPRGTVSKNVTENDFISLGETSQKIEKIYPKNQLISRVHRMEKPFSKTSSQLENLILPARSSIKSKKKCNQNKVNYVSLKINRVHPNPEKNKNKNKKKKKNKK